LLNSAIDPQLSTLKFAEQGCGVEFTAEAQRRKGFGHRWPPVMRSPNGLSLPWTNTAIE